MDIASSEIPHDGTIDMITEKEDFGRKIESDVTFFPVLDEQAMLGSSYVVERRSHVNGIA